MQEGRKIEWKCTCAIVHRLLTGRGMNARVSPAVAAILDAALRGELTETQAQPLSAYGPEAVTLVRLTITRHVSSQCASGGGYFFRVRAACWRMARPLADSGSMSHRVCQLAAARSTSPMFWSASARLA